MPMLWEFAVIMWVFLFVTMIFLYNFIVIDKCMFLYKSKIKGFLIWMW